MKKKILLTCPIFYPNDRPHIGTLHTMILSDFIKRSFMVFDYDVYLTQGTDEHSEKVRKKAESLGIDTQCYVDNIAITFKNVLNKFSIDFDRFIQTSEECHKKTVMDIWSNLQTQGLIYKGEYEGYYSVDDETFFSESSLINGRAPTGSEVIKEAKPAYFFRSSLFREKLLQLYEEKNFTTPNNRIHEMKGFISKEYKDLCISRYGSWGIPVPGDKDFIIYVWFDALINYLTVILPQNIEELWNNTRVIHIVGKDIAIFHGVHWPAMIFAMGNLKIFDDLLIHNWWLIDEAKMSKSKQNVIDPMEIEEMYGKDALRFYCIYNNLIKNDDNFSIECMLNLYNSFLVDKFSNLIYRLWVILYKAKGDNINKEIINNESMENKLREHMEKLEINSYLEVLFHWIDSLNAKINNLEAWKNVDLCEKIFCEALSMVRFFDAITPGVFNTIQKNKKPVKLFSKILVK